MRYLRHYPPLMQLLLFMLMVFTLFWFFYLIQVSLLPKITGVALTALRDISVQSPPQVIRTALLSQAITHVSIFLFPALLFAYLAHPRPAYVLGMRRPGKPLQWLIVTVLMIGLIPVMLGIESMMELVNLGAEAKKTQAANESTIRAFLQQKDTTAFLVVLTVMAVLPALGEELFFRGIIMRFAHKRSQRLVAIRQPIIILDQSMQQPARPKAFPVIVSALLFTAVHISPYGSVSIFIAGVALALIYWLTGSIWCSIWAHFLNNGLQVALYFAAEKTPALKKNLEANTLPPLLIVAGAALVVLGFFWLWKNKTPLPANWSDDFAGEARQA